MPHFLKTLHKKRLSFVNQMYELGKERKMPVIIVFFHPLHLFGPDTNPWNILRSILACVLLSTGTVKLLHFTAETREVECVGGS